MEVLVGAYKWIENCGIANILLMPESVYTRNQTQWISLMDETQKQLCKYIQNGPDSKPCVLLQSPDNPKYSTASFNNFDCHQYSLLRVFTWWMVSWVYNFRNDSLNFLEYSSKSQYAMIDMICWILIGSSTSMLKWSKSLCWSVGFAWMDLTLVDCIYSAALTRIYWYSLWVRWFFNSSLFIR